MFEIYDCDKRGNVVDWLDLCVKEIHNLWAENKLPVVVGGTGFYAEALLNEELLRNLKRQRDEQKKK